MVIRVGADATNSVGLPDGRDCWIFSDTITSSSATGLTFAHNSILVTGRGRPRVIANPMPQPSHDAFYWAGAARVHGAQIWEIAQRIDQTGSLPSFVAHPAASGVAARCIGVVPE